MNDELNHWRKLRYYDPAEILLNLRRIEAELAAVDLDPRVRRLRTSRLRQYRESRDAALFAYGMSRIRGQTVAYSPLENGDYDFVTTWSDDNTRYFCAAQLKELVPEDLNPSATLEALLEAARSKYRPTTTVLVVKLNRRISTDLSAVDVKAGPFAQTWFFWASNPEATQWQLYGDAGTGPAYYQFDYPAEPV